MFGIAARQKCGKAAFRWMGSFTSDSSSLMKVRNRIAWRSANGKADSKTRLAVHENCSYCENLIHNGISVANI